MTTFSLLFLLCTFPAHEARAEAVIHVADLTPGWDIFNAPLTRGVVKWSAEDSADGTKLFKAVFELRGSQPDHAYTAGVHFFEPRGKKVKEVTKFGGWKVGDQRGEITRDGVSATGVGGWDFGVLRTDERGNASARFEFPIPSEDYYMQFTVRAGRCRPAEGVTDGCAAVFRTGGKLGETFEVITGRGQAPVEERTTALTPGWDIFSAPLAMGRVRWSAADAENGRKRFNASFELRGAEPNHSYTVGAHFFEPKGGKAERVTQFGGWKVGDERSELTRDGVSAVCVGGWDFGILTTDEAGNGETHHDFLIPSGNYHLQFTVRTGKCRPAEGVTDGCAVVYRSGNKLGQKLETILGRPKPDADPAPKHKPSQAGVNQ